jgi:hypothetical protein
LYTTWPSSSVGYLKKTRRKTAQEQNTDGKHAESEHVKKGSKPKTAAKQNP